MTQPGKLLTALIEYLRVQRSFLFHGKALAVSYMLCVIKINIHRKTFAVLLKTMQLSPANVSTFTVHRDNQLPWTLDNWPFKE